MTKRQYFADSLKFVHSVLSRLHSGDLKQPTVTEVTNALRILTDASAFLNKEQAAIDLLTERDDSDT